MRILERVSAVPESFGNTALPYAAVLDKHKRRVADGDVAGVDRMLAV
jgi:hypothetical protein